MKATRQLCNDQLLLAMLQDELSQASSDRLLSHIELCSHCQTRLRELVAPDQDWYRVSQLLADCSSLSHGISAPESRTISPEPNAWTESSVKQLLSPPTHPEMLGRFGRYDVERLIGTGGMGIVFKAFDHELNRPVAIKLLAPHLAGSGSARKRFSREARAAAAVSHPNVVPIHSVDTEQQPPFLVMQYVSGESLQARLDREGPLELCELLRIGNQVAGGLAAAHKQGLVHRDIKPSNILLEEEVERAFIGDFGLARAVDDASLTRTGFHPGTPSYMSPEQASGQLVDARSDLFSLGTMLYRMCTGRSPFRADTSLGVMQQIVEAEPIPIQELNPSVPAWLVCLIEKLMAKDKADRFQSAAEVHRLLEACLSHSQQPETVPLPPIPSVRRGRMLNPRRNPFRGNVAMKTLFGLSLLFGSSFFFPENWWMASEVSPPKKDGQAEVQDEEAGRAPEPLPKTALFEITVNGKQGFIDRTGKIVIEPQFDSVYPFSEGLAAAQFEGRWGFIDVTGKFVIEPKFISVAPFSGNRTRVRIDKFTDPWGYIDTNGTVVIEPQYDCAEDFHNGIARVGMQTTKNKLLSRIADIGIQCDHYYIDLSGKKVPKPDPTHYATGKPNELIRFQRDDLVGYMDAEGTVIIQPQFLAGSGFSDGLASVRKGDLFGYIDRTGKFVIPPKFQWSNDFSEGLAGLPLEGKKWGFIDRTGKTVIPAKYDWIYGGFRAGLAKVSVAGRIGYINKKGEWVW